MKRLWITITIVLIGLVGLGGFIFWRMSQTTPTKEPVLDVSSQTAETIPTVVSTKPTPGTYLVYQTTTISDRGKPDLVNDDVHVTKVYQKNLADGSEQLLATSQLVTDGPVLKLYGKDVLFHRYNGPDDAVIALDGTVTTKKSEWGTFRSKDGRFEVHYTSIYDNPKANTVDIRVVNLVDNTEKKYTLTSKDLANFSPGQPIPVGITLDGTTLFLSSTNPGSDTPTSGRYFSVAVDTWVVSEITPKEIPVQKNESMSIKFFPEQQMMLVSVYGTEPCTDCMGGVTATAPSKIYLYSIVQKTAKLILENKDFLISPVRLSEDGTLLAYGINNENIWVTLFNAPKTNDQLVMQGTLLDWMDIGMVVERKGGDFVYIDSATKKITQLGRSIGSYNDADYQKFEYIGAVTLP